MASLVLSIFAALCLFHAVLAVTLTYDSCVVAPRAKLQQTS